MTSLLDTPTAPTTPAPTPATVPPATSLDDALVTALVTSLFSTPLPRIGEDPSTRAAYQDALYGRAVLVDIRSHAARHRDGRPSVPHEVVEATGAGAEIIARLSAARPVLLLSDTGDHAARIAAHLRHLGAPWVHAVQGGFTAWRAAGLPMEHDDAEPETFSIRSRAGQGLARG